jgi:hypothetical protein
MARARGSVMADPRANASIAEIIRGAIEEAKDWLKAEFALARAQLSESLGNYANALIAWGSAALLVLLALVFLGFGFVLLLAPYVGDTAAVFIVGLALLVAAAAAFLYGRAQFQRANAVPSRIARALSQDDAVDRRADP